MACNGCSAPNLPIAGNMTMIREHQMTAQEILNFIQKQFAVDSSKSFGEVAAELSEASVKVIAEYSQYQWSISMEGPIEDNKLNLGKI